MATFTIFVTRFPHQAQGVVDISLVVEDSHQRSGDSGRVLVLHHVPAVHDAARSLGQHRRSPLEQGAVVDPSAATDENRNIAGDLDHLVIVLNIVGRVGLDHIGPQLPGLADQCHDLVGVPIDHVSASRDGIVLHHQRFDHQRYRRTWWPRPAGP